MGFKPACSAIETSQKIGKFARSKSRYDTFQSANEGADQTAWMRRLVCAFVVRKPLKTGYLIMASTKL